MAKSRPHPNDDQRGGYVRSLVIKKAAGSGGNAGTPYTADWSALPSDLIARLVWAVNIQGGSILFGQTRNGHTLTISLYSGTDKAHWYFEQTEAGYTEFENLAASIIEAAYNSPEGLESPFQER